MDSYLMVVGMAGIGILLYYYRLRERQQTSGLSKPVEDLTEEEVGPEMRSLCNSVQYRMRQAAGDVALVFRDVSAIGRNPWETWLHRAHQVGLPGPMVPKLFPELADSGDVDSIVIEAYDKLRQVFIDANISIVLLRQYGLDAIIQADLDASVDQWLVALDRLDYFLWDIGQYPSVQQNQKAYIIYIALGQSWLETLLRSAVRGVFT